MQTSLRILMPLLSLLFAQLAGCGTALQRNGTEQLLLSDSVDRAIDQLDLSGLAGRRVFLDTEYMKNFKGNNIHISSDYTISALRQKMTTSGLLVETARADADYVLEARIGALGTDTMEVTYGIPSSNGLGAAASAVSGVPMVPVIPEISFGKRNGAVGVSKVVVFAYHRETGLPVWQSGAAVARSNARDSWFLGVGPLTQGSVYDGPLLAGNRINLPFSKKTPRRTRGPLTIADRQQFVHPAVLERQLADAQAAAEQAAQPAQAETSAQPAQPTQPPTPAAVSTEPPTPVPPTPPAQNPTGLTVTPAVHPQNTNGPANTPPVVPTAVTSSTEAAPQTPAAVPPNAPAELSPQPFPTLPPAP